MERAVGAQIVGDVRALAERDVLQLDPEPLAVALEEGQPLAQRGEVVAIAFGLELLPGEHQLRTGDAIVGEEAGLFDALVIAAEVDEVLRLHVRRCGRARALDGQRDGEEKQRERHHVPVCYSGLGTESGGAEHGMPPGRRHGWKP